MTDARFMDAGPGPVTLRAMDEDDLLVISSLVQDAILPMTEMTYDPKKRQLAMLINRFRWEDMEPARREGRDYERVRSLLVISDVLSVKSDGIDRNDRDLVLSLLSLRWQKAEDGTGTLLLDFAGDGTIAARAECISVDLRDVTRPYIAPSRAAPKHPD